MLWILSADLARLGHKYGARSARFALLEAGHIMQNLCLVGASVSLPVLPLGGFFEEPIARRLNLPASDSLLYVGVS